jgi:hypothetical protein
LLDLSFSVKGAAFISKPGAAPQDYVNPNTSALKARFAQFESTVNRIALSALVFGAI